MSWQRVMGLRAFRIKGGRLFASVSSFQLASVRPSSHPLDPSPSRSLTERHLIVQKMAVGVGTRISKMFQKAWYDGTVKKIWEQGCQKYYFVKYDDGDREDLTARFFSPLLLVGGRK